MYRPLHCLAVACALALAHVTPAFGQFGGSRAGVERTGGDVPDLPMLNREIAESYIAIEGRAEIRVRPTELRVVLAVTSEGETAQECQKTVDATIERLKAGWAKLGIAADRVAVDFIAVLPRYDWSLEKRGTREVGVERKAGYRMQTNVHIAARGDAEARAAFNRAFEEGVTDIIAFDYWSKELDDVKVKAREQALKAARSKADVLLTALFEKRPPAINVQEQTTVRYPESLYHSFQNTYETTVTTGERIPFIAAHRPRNTYYRGLYSNGDVQPRELPMTPEISVISTVRLYFQSPAAERRKPEGSNRPSAL